MPKMSAVPSRQARLAHAAKHAELWNAGKREDWIASWRTIAPAEVRMFDPVGTEEKQGFDTATGDAFDMFQSILKITYYPMPETVGSDSDPYAHILDGQQ
jgi:hypothetical protein